MTMTPKSTTAFLRFVSCACFIATIAWGFGTSVEVDATGDCAQYTSCKDCAGVNNCGWCSQPVVYGNGSTGPQCASPQSGTPFTCNGIFSTSQCIKGYICNQATGTCDRAPPGAGVSKDTCEQACTVGPSQKVYGCKPHTHVCHEVPGGTPGAASKAECEKHCFTPSAKVYKCNASGGVCVVVPPGTPGSSSKEVCEATGCDFGSYGCDLSDFKCKEGHGNSSKHYCDKDCKPANDPCEQYTSCDVCLSSNPVCGWCSQNVTYASGQIGGQCAGVNASILPFQCLGSYSTKLCNATTAMPTPAPTPAPPPSTNSPTFSPTLPPNNRPYLRFGHTVPTHHRVNANITQGSTSYVWSNYSFAQFSHWVEIFAVSDATITIYDASNGNELMSTTISLTPGPLVIVTKDYWPPTYPYNIEVIAASYAPAQSGSGVRLFNLSPDTPSADMYSSGNLLVAGILYSLGSVWVPVPTGTGSYKVTNTATGTVLARDTFTAPPAPYVFTNFLVGLANTTDANVKSRLVALVDAPE